MKNRKFIKTIITDFNEAKEAGTLPIALDDLNRRITRFKNNFDPSLDEFSFTLHFEIKQPRKELIEKLQNEGKHHLITNNPLDISLQEHMKNEYDLHLRISIRAMVDAPTGQLDDDDNEIWTVEMRHVGTAKYDIAENRIVMAASPASYKGKLKEAISYLNEWFKYDFGQLREF